MSVHQDGGPAFPVPTSPGMTLRDWFAGQALAGRLADPTIDADFRGHAIDAYRFADAMLKERAK